MSDAKVKDKLYVDRARVANGRFSVIYRATKKKSSEQDTQTLNGSVNGDATSSNLYALKVIDVDDGEAAPHSLKVEINILKFLKEMKSVEPSRVANVIDIVDTFTIHDDCMIVFLFYQYTLADYFKKNSRIKTNFNLLLKNRENGMDQSDSLISADPFDDYFQTDDLYDTNDDDDSEEAKPSQIYLRVNKIEPLMALRIIKKIFQGLQFIHEHGIIHRDLKPENILFNTRELGSSPDIDPVIIDFGISYADESLIGSDKVRHIASRYDFYRLNEPTPKQKQTQISTGVYKPPEVVLGITDYGTELDIWSFGILVTQFFSKSTLPILSKSGNFSDIMLLNTVFQTFGTPDETVWPRVKHIKYFQAFKFAKWERKPDSEILPRLTLTYTNDEEKQLFAKFQAKVFNRMVVYDENKRITAREALAVFEQDFSDLV